MKAIRHTIALIGGLLATLPLAAQCISDECGDIFADWAILNESIAVCEGVTFEVENQTLFPDIDFYVWDWGNGDRDTVYEVSNYFYTYEFSDNFACSVESNLIVYNISLEIYRSCEAGQSCHTQIAPVAVRLRPRAGFRAPDVVCAGESTVLINETCGAGDYLWIFPDGTTSTDVNPQHVFNTYGEQEVTLIVNNECGTDTIVGSVNVAEKPAAAASIDESRSISSCGSTIVTFANDSEDADYYYWDFPSQSGYTFLNGTHPGSPNPSVQFTNSGTYEVYLMAGNDCAESQWQTTVEVRASPVVALQPIPASCDTMTVTLMDYAEIRGTYESLHWTISGPEELSVPTTDNPEVAFATPGQYSIQLEATSADCPNGVASTSLEIHTPQALELTTPALAALCTGSAPLSLEASLPGGTWIGPGTDPSTGVFDPAAAGTGVHTIQYVAQSACQEVATTTVTVLASAPVTISSPVSACLNDAPIQLTATPTGGSWSGAGITDPTMGVFDPAAADLGTNEITYSLVDDNNCAVVATVEAAVRAVPRIEVPDSYQICNGQDEVNLSALYNPVASPAGGTLSWSGNGVVDAASGRFIHASNSGTYPLTVEYTLNGCTARSSLELAITEPSVPTAPDQAFCQSEALVQLQASPVGGVWSGPGLVDAANGSLSPATLSSGDYVYTYTVNAGTACEASTQMQLAIWDDTVIEAGPQQTYCATQNSAQLPLGYPAGGAWSGPGVTDPLLGTVDLSGLDPDNTYTYEYRLEVAGLACELTDQMHIVFHPEPELDLSIPETACLNAPVSLLVRPQPNVTYRWHLPDGTTYPGPAVQYAFANAGHTSVSLVATTAAGCVAETSANLRIANPPQAQMIPSVAQGCEPLAVAFGNTSEGDIDSYYWDFGNGQTSSDAVPAPQNFTAQPFTNTVYSVSLVVSNVCGEDRTVQDIVVKPHEFRTFFQANTTEGCAPLQVDLQDYNTEENTVVWDFGDGFTGAGASVAHTFTEPGNYTVQQIASNGCAQDTMAMIIEVRGAPSADFTHRDAVCPDDPVSFTLSADDFQTIHWDFGDGHSSTARQPDHRYDIPGNYTVTLTLNSNSTGCAARATSEVKILERPTVNIAADSQVGCPPLDVCFTAESEDALYYEWNFGDGNGNNNLRSCHTFTTSGAYPVYLRGISEAGCTSLPASLEVQVYDQPEAKILTPTELVCGFPQELKFGSASTNAVAHQWTFSDGSTSELSAPRVVVDKAGEYMAKLEVANTFGCTDIATSHIEVKPRPLADFGAFYRNDCVPQDVVFDNFSTEADSYLWLFGDGRQSTKSKPTQYYTEPGEYDITLIVGREDVCFDTLTLTREVSLRPSPTAAFSWETPSADYEGLIQFRNESIDAISYAWDFGDGHTSTEVDPLHDYRVNGNWLASLLATAANGCTDTALVELKPEVIYGLHFPNAFSPETGMGDVRVFKPAGLGLESWDLEIFSPWGERVFQSRALIEDQPGVAWDGQYKGKILPQGAYAYKASVRFLNGLQKVYTGSVTLLR
jgi:PKD repeat protein